MVVVKHVNLKKLRLNCYWPNDTINKKTLNMFKYITNYCLLVVIIVGCQQEELTSHNDSLTPLFEFSNEVFLVNAMHMTKGVDDRIYISDNHPSNVKVFSIDGSYLKTISRRGGGPGELISPMGLTSNDSLLIVEDSGNHRKIVFDSNGVFLKSFKNERIALSLSMNETEIFTFSPTALFSVGDLDQESLITVYNLNGDISNEFGEYLMFNEKIPAGMSWPYLRAVGEYLHLSFRYYPLYRVYSQGGDLIGEFDLTEIIPDLINGYIDQNTDESSKNPSAPKVNLFSRALDVHGQDIFLVRDIGYLTIDHLKYDNGEISFIDTYNYTIRDDEYAPLDMFFSYESNSFYVLEYYKGDVQVRVYNINDVD